MLEKESFLNRYKLTKIFQVCSIPWEDLNRIYTDYCQRKEVLELTARELSRRFSEEFITGKQSVGYRVKNEEHLIEKIIRNNVEDNAVKYKNVNYKNYYKLVTDLIGLRVLVLSKENWEETHDYIISAFQNENGTYINYKDADCGYTDDENLVQLAEPPVAYIRYGDRDIFKKKLRTKYTYKDYRGQHYIIKYKNTYCEIQVKTLAEQVYSEFDHQVRYPYKKDNKFLIQYTSMLSKIMVAADDILSLCSKLPEDIIEKCNDYYEEDIYPDLTESNHKNQIIREDHIPSIGNNLQGLDILDYANQKIERRLENEDAKTEDQ